VIMLGQSKAACRTPRWRAALWTGRGGTMFQKRRTAEEPGDFYCILALLMAAVLDRGRSGRSREPLMLADVHPSPRAVDQWAEFNRQFL
jgi:hypothetical protein